MKQYIYSHLVSFEETNLVGNVYFTNYLAWQGKCREKFIHDHAPELLDALRQDLALVTVRCSCEYLAESFAFDNIEIRMSLTELGQNQIGMDFEYWRVGPTEELIAKGHQQVACMKRAGDQTLPTPIPLALAEALKIYR